MLASKSTLSSQDVQQIFSNLQELHELSVQLLGSLDECIEMAAELGGKGRCPHAGFVFEELAEVRKGWRERSKDGATFPVAWLVQHTCI